MRTVLAVLCTALLGFALIGTAAPAEAMSASANSRVMNVAASVRGTPYVYGGASPRGFDCSGFVMWTMRHVGKDLPHSSAAQSRRGYRVSRSQARPGDLVFFYGSSVYHAAIYAGHGYVWEATHPGQGLGKHKIWSSRIFFKRLR